ncbi:hypothetical protein LBMAG53_09910 [Planctomycetota bacterium]|nr:hypothetical protein LBMAG53_09910 [Planctomycetota bacterium]
MAFFRPGAAAGLLPLGKLVLRTATICWRLPSGHAVGYNERVASLRFSAAALLIAWCGAAQALEPPSGIAAFVGEFTAQDQSIAPEKPPCGGALVLISADGLALSLAEALPPGDGPWKVVFPGSVADPAQGPALATVVRRGATSTGVLLRIGPLPSGAVPLTGCAGDALTVGMPVWSAGNSHGTIELDGQVALSRGIVSGRSVIEANDPPVRGRHGKILSLYRGPVIEVDAAINDGNQGGALLDDAGRLAGLVSLGAERARRMGTAVPLPAILADLGLRSADLGGDPLPAPRPPSADETALISATTVVARSVALVAFDRPRGPGNPQAVPRPPRAVDEAPGWERRKLRDWWAAYWHQQQVFFADQPVTAVALGGTDLVTSASNLHGEATNGRVLLAGGSVACSVVAVDVPLDLALLRAERDLGLPAAPLAKVRPALGTTVGLLGRHRADSGHTLTIGGISAADRRLDQWPYALLQVDCLANYGSLGGPLVTADGTVAGLLVLLGPGDDRPWLVNSGVAMAVDAPTLAEAVTRLKTGASRDRPRLVGLGIRHRYEGDDSGVLVQEVVPGTGAAAAGLQAGDRILRLNGNPVSDHQSLSRLLLRRQPGDRVDLTIDRAGQRLVLTVELKEF